MKFPSIFPLFFPCLFLLFAGSIRAQDGAEILPQPGVKLAPDLVGEWVVASVNGRELPEGTPSAIFRFSADGSIVRMIGTVEQKGTYHFSDDRKSLDLVSERGKEKLEVEDLTEEALTIVSGDEKIILSRLPASEEVAAERELDGDLVGNWKLIVLGGDGVGDDDDTVFEFKADGTVSRTRSGTIKNGTYSLSADRALLTLTREGTTEGDVLEVISLTHSTMHLKEGSNTMELTRIDSKEEAGESKEGVEGEDGKEGDPGAEPKAEGEEAPAEKPKDGKIYGRWRVVAMEGFPEGIEKPTFQFNQDGTVTGSFGDQVKRGKFKLSEDRSTLTMMDKGQALEDGEVAEVLELSETVMELKADEAILKFERVHD